MRRLGLCLLFIGFLWIAWGTSTGFVMYQHMRWWWHSGTLPQGQTVPRDAAISAMRDLSLELKDKHRMILIPATLMLAGGLTAAYGRRK